MKREIITTADGSSSIKIVEWDEQYHSVHGAINEAQHVFIKNGLQYFCETNPDLSEIQILEIGFGTGLNLLVSFSFSKTISAHIDYTGIEAYPVGLPEIEQLNYPELLKLDKSFYHKIHRETWGSSFTLSENFSLKKEIKLFQELDFCNDYDIIYFDAFGPRVQPELWEQPVFDSMYNALALKGILVTYCAKGDVRRRMISAGFSQVERLVGPPGKREMLRATK